jgi:hypothetical protein
MVRRGDADLHRRLARCIDDWGTPIGGQRIVDYDDQDLRVFKSRANTRPVFFRAQRTASADESLVGCTCARMNAQKITRSGYPLCKAPMLNHDPASVCPRNWHDTENRLFRSAFPLIPGTA